jgi:ribonucleoside-diphosphate reductase alpha chain
MSNNTTDMTTQQHPFIDKNEMHVTKRNGKIEIVSFDKILMRIKKIGQEVDIKLNYTNLAMKVIDQLYDMISTTKIDELSAEQCASMASIHPDYNTLAGRIVVSNHHKNTPTSFTEAISLLYNNVDVHGNHTPLVSEELYSVVNKYPKELDAICDYKKDYLIEYFGFKTLERAYLMKINGKTIERPQHMWLRVAIGIHGDNLQKIVETYDLMSNKYFTHATPTLFNAGTPHPQLSSCFLIAMEEDSMEGIYNTLKDCAMISKWSGGIGLHIHNIRAAGSKIRGTNGASNGIVPMLKVFNNTAKYANQGGKRNGSFAIYLEPWHADLELFLQMRKNHGDEELKARDLFYALWMPDLFMERIKTGGQWTFMCPDECPGLSDVWGDDFKALYTKYESEGKGRKTVLARDIWFQILDSQMETGTPYLVYKDAANKKSNQKNVGTIKSSNLCSEIIEYSDNTETAVCNLGSIALPAFIDNTQNPPVFDYEKLHQITRVLTYNLNRIIDVNFYPTEKTKKSNMRHRPIGIGVQGLADVFMMMNVPFHSDSAKELNRNIFETIYHGALEESTEIAVKEGSYETFEGSPASQGILQFDMWNVDPGNDRYDWSELKARIQKQGLRNSLLLAPMPTASTSQILGYNECIEPITSNIYSRRTLAGEFIIANKYLMNDLIQLGLWNEKIKNNIIANNGSIQQIDIIPEHIRNKYKTVWEMPMRQLIDMAADRGAFICQSQSLNLWLEDPNYSTLTSMHFYAWSKGLKTGIYYLRRRGRHQAQQFTIEVEKKVDNNHITDEDTICESCSA